MIQHSFFKLQNTKKMLIIIFSLIIVLSVSILITTEIIKSRPQNIQQSIADRFNKIKVQLEFKGFTKNVKEMTEDYSKLFDGYSNIIITDDNGKIVYKVNDGYISEKDKFLVLIDPWQANGFDSDIAYLIDSKNTIKYAAQLDIALNINKLKEQSSKNTLSKALFSQLLDSDDSLGEPEITNSDGSTYVISSETKIMMNYEYIASKGLNLYSLYDSEHQFNNYFIFTNFLQTVSHWMIIITVGFIILFWILLPLWVFKDAQNKHLNVHKWAILTFFLNVFGLGIYLIFRPKSAKYPSCNQDIQDNWILCPNCGKKIKV